MKPTLNPYIIFGGTCREAMQFYQSVLGGELKMQTYSEAKMSKHKETEDKIIHASLMNDTLTFMASDDAPDHKVKPGNNVQMSIFGSDEEKLTEIFNKLSEDGKVPMPLKKEFGGDTFGMFTDKFGISWMIDISAKA